MASTNLLFSLLAWSGKSELLFAIAVIFDDMAVISTVLFVALFYVVDRTIPLSNAHLHQLNCWTNTLAASSGASRLVKCILNFFIITDNGNTSNIFLIKDNLIND